MKNSLHTTAKLLLVLVIFLGLQGRVIARYAEVFHKGTKTEASSNTGYKSLVKAKIAYCKLQSYTQPFKVLQIPAVELAVILMAVFFVTAYSFLLYREQYEFAGCIRLLPLRAPPNK